MKKLLILAALLVITAGCTDAERGSMFRYNDNAAITCYSGGQVIFEDTSTGATKSLGADGFAYRSAKTGKFVRVFADCILTSDSN